MTGEAPEPPVHGIRVLDLTGLLPGLFASRVLAEPDSLSSRVPSTRPSSRFNWSQEHAPCLPLAVAFRSRCRGQDRIDQ
jgi:hypothetical protein